MYDWYAKAYLLWVIEYLFDGPQREIKMRILADIKENGSGSQECSVARHNVYLMYILIEDDKFFTKKYQRNLPFVLGSKHGMLIKSIRSSELLEGTHSFALHASHQVCVLIEEVAKTLLK